jgi:DNA-binding CsgD family transcriptional regulator
MIGEHDRLIGLIYEGIIDESPWGVALERVSALVGAVGVGLGMQDMASHQFRSLGDRGIDSNLMQTYRRLAPTNKIWMEIARRRQPLTDRMVMTKADFVLTELYTDWFKPQGFHGVMAVPTLFKKNASAVLVAFRDRRREDFECADLKKISSLAYHFGRALSIRLDRERTEEEFSGAKLVLDDIPDAILFVDCDVRLKHANNAGNTMLDGGKVIRRLLNGRLEIRDRQANERFAAMVSGAQGGELRFSGLGLKGFVIRVHACTKGADHIGAGVMIVRIVDLNRKGEPPTPARLLERFGLSLRQSEVMSELARGGTEASAAQKLGIEESTVHEHIRRLYDKLELRSRAELMALLARADFDTTSHS